MSIEVQCTSCKKRYAVKGSAAGRTMRCPKCGERIRIPNAVASDDHPVGIQENRSSPAIKRNSSTPRQPSQNPPELSKKRRQGSRKTRSSQTKRSEKANSIPQDSDEFNRWLTNAFQKDVIQPVRVTMSYTLALFVVVLIMVTLPIIYVALIAGVAWVTFWGTTMAMAFEPQAVGVSLAVLLAFSGLVTVLFMLKPLFSRPPHSHGLRTLTRDEEPLLFLFVERICDVVGAPYPKEIDIDGTINAGASLQGGFRNLFGRDVRLLIGMPLVAGLSVQQFAGVLAHEFGHFSQGTGMRLSNLVRMVSFWFARVVYERDAWDERLHRLSEESGPIGQLVLMLTHFGIWGTRRILWLLMVAGHTSSGFLLRQMEFDADRFKVRVAGCKALSSTLRRLSVLEMAHQGAIGDLQQFFDEGRLADDLPQLIALNIDEIPKSVRKKLKEHHAEEQTRIFDTHPCLRDRIESAQEDGSEGIFLAKGHASGLFSNFGMRARNVTLDYYVEIFGPKFKKKLLRPVSELVEFRRIHKTSLKTMRRYFQGNFSWYRCFHLSGSIWTPLDLQNKSEKELRNNRRVMQSFAVKYENAWNRYDDAEGQLIEAKLARRLIDAQFEIHDGAFSLPLATRTQIRQATDTLGIRQGKFEATLRGFEEAAAKRMSVALRMARSPETSQQLKRRRLLTHELDELLQIYIHISERTHLLTEIHDQQLILGKLLQLVSHGHRHDAIYCCINEQMEFLYEKISSLHRDFLLTPYPFDHAQAGITLAEYMLKKKRLPKYSDPLALYNAAEGIATSLPYVMSRVLGRLSEYAEAVETEFGLSPLNDPPDEDDRAV